MKFNKVVIIGVGLIGGSIGLAIRKKKLAKEVCGIFRRPSSMELALKAGAVDTGTIDYSVGLKDAELVIIATPVGEIAYIARLTVKHLKDNVILTDVGSTKQLIVSEIEKIVPPSVKFVGAHPMAGSEKTGVLEASEYLFKNSICIVTKTDRTDKRSLRKMLSFWKDLGARTKVLTPAEHDSRVASISHLPHLAAFSLALSADTKSLMFAANGFKDTTRVASSDPKMWNDIFLSNKKAVLDAARKYRMNLSVIEKSILANDSKKLVRLLKKAGDIRSKVV